MNDIADYRVGPMRNPPHLGELVRESMDEAGWNVAETAVRLGCERGTLSRLLNGKAGVVGEHGARAGTPCIIGSADAVVQRLREIIDGTGVFGTLLMLAEDSDEDEI